MGSDIDIAALVGELRSHDDMARLDAKLTLERLGEQALAPLQAIRRDGPARLRAVRGEVRMRETASSGAMSSDVLESA